MKEVNLCSACVASDNSPVVYVYVGIVAEQSIQNKVWPSSSLYFRVKILLNNAFQMQGYSKYFIIHKFKKQ